jgi:phosphinothricin acetyltransferase
MMRGAKLEDLSAILDIYNDAVLHTTAIRNDSVADHENRRAWYLEWVTRNYPVFVAEPNHKVVGYASFGDETGWLPGVRREIRQTP